MSGAAQGFYNQIRIPVISAVQLLGLVIDILGLIWNAYTVVVRNVRIHFFVCVNFLLGKTCSPYDHCSECHDSNHRLMEKALKDRLPGSLTLLGSQDCFLPSDVVDYVYTDATHFKPCMSNCKRCTSGTDCQECGSYSDPAMTYYLFSHTSPVSCLASCDASQNRFVVPGASVSTCHECPAGQYYVEGSNPPQCTACNTGAVWIESSTKLCKPCGSGCSSCTSDTSCQSCSDSTHFIQVDGGTCSIGCNEKEMETAGTPKRCQACPIGCAACSEGGGCTSCENGYYKDGTTQCQVCPSGCATCLSGSECLTCSDPNHFLGTDKITCALNCKKKTI